VRKAEHDELANTLAMIHEQLEHFADFHGRFDALRDRLINMATYLETEKESLADKAQKLLILEERYVLYNTTRTKRQFVRGPHGLQSESRTTECHEGGNRVDARRTSDRRPKGIVLYAQAFIVGIDQDGNEHGHQGNHIIHWPPQV
jgi:hypothetical protein